MAELEILYNPEEIERKSYEIIRAKLERSKFRNELEFELAVRVAHSTADIEIANSLFIHPEFLEASQKSLEMKLPIFVDVEMARAGIEKYAESLGVEVICAVSDPEVISRAKELGITRSAMAVRKILLQREIGLLVCGNSPTFLAEAIKLIEKKQKYDEKNSLNAGYELNRKDVAELDEITSGIQDEISRIKIPKAIIGVPVGFISAETVKNYLIENGDKIGVPFISNLSPKGGTAVAVSITLFIINLVRKKLNIKSGYGQHS